MADWCSHGAALALTLLAGCSQDAAVKVAEPSRSVRIDLSFAQTRTWPGRLQVELGAFGSDQTLPLTRITVPRAGDSSAQQLELALPEATRSVAVYLARNGVPQVVLARAAVSGFGDTARIPLGVIALATTERVEAQVFAAQCIQCHGASASAPAAGLDLTKGKALGNLLGVQSRNSDRKLLVPGDTASSFLWDVVVRKVDLIQSHGSFSLEEEDMQLLSTWIREGVGSSTASAARVGMP